MKRRAFIGAICAAIATAAVPAFSVKRATTYEMDFLVDTDLWGEIIGLKNVYLDGKIIWSSEYRVRARAEDFVCLT